MKQPTGPVPHTTDKFIDPAIYSLARQASEALAQTINEITVHPDDAQELLPWLIYERLLTDYQAFLLLAEHGMYRQCQMLLRCLLEVVFDLAAWHKHPELKAAFTTGEDSDRRQVLHNLLIEQATTATLTESELKQLSQICTSADESDRKALPTAIKAEFAGMLHLYRTDYQLLSESVHTDIHSLQDDSVTDRFDDHVIQVNTLVSSQYEMNELVLQATEYLLTGLAKILKLQQITATTEINALQHDLQHLWHRQISAAHPKK